MAAAMGANTLVSLIPASMTKFVPILVGVFATPLSLVFDADTFYYGILPCSPRAPPPWACPARGSAMPRWWGS